MSARPEASSCRRSSSLAALATGVRADARRAARSQVSAEQPDDVLDDARSTSTRRPPQPGDSATADRPGLPRRDDREPDPDSVAREFLTAEAAAAWNPERAMVTYADASTPTGDAGVDGHADDADRLDARGAWRRPLARDAAHRARSR